MSWVQEIGFDWSFLFSILFGCFALTLVNFSPREVLFAISSSFTSRMKMKDEDIHDSLFLICCLGRNAFVFSGIYVCVSLIELFAQGEAVHHSLVIVMTSLFLACVVIKGITGGLSTLLIFRNLGRFGHNEALYLILHHSLIFTIFLCCLTTLLYFSDTISCYLKVLIPEV